MPPLKTENYSLNFINKSVNYLFLYSIIGTTRSQYLLLEIKERIDFI